MVIKELAERLRNGHVNVVTSNGSVKADSRDLKVIHLPGETEKMMGTVYGIKGNGKDQRVVAEGFLVDGGWTVEDLPREYNPDDLSPESIPGGVDLRRASR